MLRLNKILFPFCQFYPPCPFQLDHKHLAQQACQLTNYVNIYRRYGHLYAKLDPLQIYNKEYKEFVRPTDVGISFQSELSSFESCRTPVVAVSKSVEQLQKNLIAHYLGNVGVQFEHVETLEERKWLYDNYERIKMGTLSAEKQREIAKTLIEVEGLDHFLHKKFVTFKRYSGEGAETTVLALDELFRLAACGDFKDVVFGMPHRGRLNTLVTILDYPPQLLFRKISGKADTPQEIYTCIDDVVSHSVNSTCKDYDGKEVQVTMVHNPSHLEAQNPVSMGKAHSKQLKHMGDQVLNVQVHGDAAICAQGIVYESLLLGKVPKFSVNGTIHIITNNQIGYTTKPIDARGSKYSSDIAKAFNIPIMHINTQSVEDVIKMMSLCMEYRKKFKKDIMVDLICYRKYGHNEVDEPEFTQPKMYHQIRKVHESITQQLQKSHQEIYQTVRDQLFAKLESSFNSSKNISVISKEEYMNPDRKGPKAFTRQWKGLVPSLFGQEQPTGFDVSALKEFAKASVFYPEKFTVHSRIKKYHIEERLKSIEGNKLNWATCEALALFSLNYEGYNIRFSGQDVERGTFSQRHINMVDQQSEEEFNPLEFFSQQNPGRGTVQISNSPLTENAAMSYEYGFSLDSPMNFTVWEAQFGDFFNTAQVVIDNFLTNSESKWLRQSGLVLLLPHGYDGAGPEHSSCRMQRFLQLANSDGGLISHQLSEDVEKPLEMQDPKFYENYKTANFSFVLPTKPANIFHALRRQMKRNFRKPLVVAGPKTLLRHSSSVSTFEELGPGSGFKQVIVHANEDRVENCEAVILCSGKYVYEVDALIKKKQCSRTALLSIQELFPFPHQKLLDILSRANRSCRVYWVQQENLNSGAFFFVERRVSRILRQLQFNHELQYVGRRAIAATAVGSAELHQREGENLAAWVSSILI